MNLIQITVAYKSSLQVISTVFTHLRFHSEIDRQIVEFSISILAENISNRQFILE